MPIRIVLAEEIDITRIGMVQVIAADPDLLLVYETKSGDSLLSKISQANADVVILSRTLPDINIDSAISTIRRESSSKVLLLLAEVSEFAEAQRLKPHGFNLRTTSAYALSAAVKSLVDFGAWLGPSLAQHVVANYKPNKESVSGSAQMQAALLAQLTAKEQEVLSLLARGRDLESIANQNGISIETVRVHVKRINKKLQVKDRSQAIAKFLGASDASSADHRANLKYAAK